MWLIITLKKIISTTLLICVLTTLVIGQSLTQTVRGTILDSDSRLPLRGATVVMLGTSPAIGTLSDAEGNFKFEKVTIGRIALRISYLGYESKTIPEIVINSGKESVLDITMQESVVKLSEAVVTAHRKGEAINEMAVISARSISPEDTKRFTGGFDDPSHILKNFAGVAQTASGNNDIIVRGNSPKYVQWRLEGVEITTPNHQMDQNGTIGGFSCLNNKLLAASDFYTGAFSPEYGDVLSGVYDVKLRAGNNEKFEAMAGVGLLGTDFTVEGPLKKGYNGSYLINSRFSNIALLSTLGLVDIPGVKTTFQDLNFKVVLPTKTIGTFSFFGLGGSDHLKVMDVHQDIWVTPGNNQMMPGITQDFAQSNFLLNTGLNHTLTINRNCFIKTTLFSSVIGMDNDVFETIQTGMVLSERELNYNSRIKRSTYTGSVTISDKINAKNKIRIGTIFSLAHEKNNQSQLNDFRTNRFNLVDYQGEINTIKSFVSWKHNFSEGLSLNAGFHNMNVLLNHKSTIEPRIAITLKTDNANSIYLGYGKHSKMENIHNYYTKISLTDGSIIEPNKDLGLLKADHYVIGYEKQIKDNLRIKTELYYQYLYNLPVENNSLSCYATINEGSDYKYVALVNKGRGRNYGIEATIERYFNNNYYFLINGSLFDSKYKTLEGVWRNTMFNSNYLVNILYGKEFERLGKKKNKTLGLNTKVFFSGGQRYIPLLRDENSNLAVDPTANQFWDYGKAYDSTLDHFFMLNLSIGYKINNPNATHEIFLDLNNLTNNKGRLSEYYDEEKPDKTGYNLQGSFMPNLMYRVNF